MDPQSVVRPSPTVACRVLGGLAVVVGTRTRTVHRFDEVATALWTFLEPGRKPDELVGFLLAAYDVDEETARRDVDEFLGELLSLGLIEAVP